MSVAEVLEPHRSNLTGLCYRMLGSASEAEDAVQETLLRAWKAYESFDGRSRVETWLHRIATNVCLDHLRSRARRELPSLEGEHGTIDDALTTRPRTHWLEPVPDARVLPDDADPERTVALRQSLRLAFVAALQHLEPRARAALLLKDVLGFSSKEIADILEATPAAINSVLQRARTTLAGVSRPMEDAPAELTATQRDVLERYVEAFHRYDVDALVQVMRADVTMCMPPYTLSLQGREAIAGWFRGRGIGCEGSRLVPTSACGSPAFGQYRRTDDGYRAWSLIVVDLDATHIRATTYFLEVETLFALFDLPLTR